MVTKLHERGLLKGEPISHEGLVKRKVKVRRGGKTFDQERWVKTGEDVPADTPAVTEKPKEPAIKGLNKPDGGKKGDVEPGTEPSSTMTKDNVEEILSLADMGAKGGIHNNTTSVIKFKNGEHAIHKKIKPEDVFGETEMYNTAKILDYDMVPEAIAGDFGKGHGSCQKWINNTEGPYDDFSLQGCKIGEEHFDDLAKIFVLDMIVGNGDRHSENIAISKDTGKCWAIDNEGWGEAPADRAILSLEDEINVGDIEYSQMMYWMCKILSPMPGIFQKQPEDGGKAMRAEAFAGFKEKVVDNLKVALENKDKIIDNYSSFEGKNSEERISNIKENIEYLEKYIGKL